MISSCGTSTDSSISGDQEFVLEMPYPNDDPDDRLYHKASATETKGGFELVSFWGRSDFDTGMLTIRFSIDKDIKAGQEIPMKDCFLGYLFSSNSNDFTFTIKNGHVYLKSITDDQIVVRFMNACFTIWTDKDFLLNGDLSFDISEVFD